MTGHTKEPWRIVDCDVFPSDGDDGLRLLEIRAGEVFKSPHKDSVAGYIDCGGKWIASGNTRADPEAQANARRIVDCVNALATIPDPLAYVQAARGMLGALERLYDHSLPTGPIGDDACDEALRAIKAFRAATGEA